MKLPVNFCSLNPCSFPIKSLFVIVTGINIDPLDGYWHKGPQIFSRSHCLQQKTTFPSMHCRLESQRDVSNRESTSPQRPRRGALSAVSTSLLSKELMLRGSSRSESNPVCGGVGPRGDLRERQPNWASEGVAHTVTQWFPGRCIAKRNVPECAQLLYL